MAIDETVTPAGPSRLALTLPTPGVTLLTSTPWKC
jgi:hypothetical protein